MYDVLNNLYHLIVLLQMETGNVPDRSNNISVSIGLQNVTDRYGKDQKAIRYNGNIVYGVFTTSSAFLYYDVIKAKQSCKKIQQSHEPNYFKLDQHPTSYELSTFNETGDCKWTYQILSNHQR